MEKTLENFFIRAATVPCVWQQARHLLHKIFASSPIWLFYVMSGLSLGTPTVSIPQLRIEANSTISVSEEMVSWMSSVSSFTGMPSTIVLTLLAHYFGRKKTLIIVAANCFIDFLLIYCSKNATDLLISQMLQGFNFASSLTVSILALSEFSSPRYRGLFLTMKAASMYWGIWVANAIGAFSNFRNIGLFGIFCSIYCIVAISLTPESPYWLSCKKKYNKCAKAHRWLKGVDETAEKELEDLINFQKALQNQKKVKKSFEYNLCKNFNNMLKPEVYKPQALCILALIMYQGSGKLVCTVYAIQIIKKITDNDSAAYGGMLVLDGVTVLGMYVGCGLSKVLKRRTLLLSASISGTFFLYAISVYLFLVKFSVVLENNYVTIALLAAFSITISCGPIMILATLIAELLPMRSRNICSTIIAFSTLTIMAVMLKISPYIFKTFGFHGAFTFFAGIMTVVIILAYKYLPETKDKTLLEIAELFTAKDKLTKPFELVHLNKNATTH